MNKINNNDKADYQRCTIKYNMGTASTDLIHASKQFISIKKLIALDETI